MSICASDTSRPISNTNSVLGRLPRTVRHPPHTDCGISLDVKTGVITNRTRVDTRAPVRFASFFNLDLQASGTRPESHPAEPFVKIIVRIRNEEHSTPTSLRVGNKNLYHNEKVPTKEGHVISSNHYLNHLDSSRFQKHIFNLN